jgi:hypothetical protein
MLDRRLEKAKLAGAEIVVCSDSMTGCKEPINQIAADKTGAACDECVHHLSLKPFGIPR